LASNAAYRHASSPHQKSQHNLTLHGRERLSQLVDRVRTRTDRFRRTETKERVRALRERLDPDDQMLLVLRVDRNLAWRDLALVMLGDQHCETDDDALEREAARLRKRFERVKTELKQLAIEAGLLKG
jgi:RNA polymerase sigma-70 factor (ECF subfamily)